MSYASPSTMWPDRSQTTPIGRLLIWGVCQCALFFVEMLCELLAPLLLLAGVAWAVVLRAVGGIHLDESSVQKVIERIPATLTVGSHVFTPGRLIADGLLLILLVAICRTLSGLLARL